ncbi:hypothetical protein [Desulforhopalus sp. IMCC35007]|uniref:hypothetical protein n=1 Tax=Desulforhopalus sp. IMCC35007 TaxID=2569543 RepID=UPI0010ADC4D6|nr:hypothetical protein [Desulforhopalus sp. IMCC35007]TKB09709.1 hypothetical protein FCL48_09680 [Desulforhopalus sp. IMCC35007]
MSTLKDVISAMKEVLLLTEKVERTGGVLTEISKELREHDRRLVRIETLVEVAKVQRSIKSE